MSRAWLFNTTVYETSVVFAKLIVNIRILTSFSKVGGYWTVLFDPVAWPGSHGMAFQSKVGLKQILITTGITFCDCVRFISGPWRAGTRTPVWTVCKTRALASPSFTISLNMPWPSLRITRDGASVLPPATGPLYEPPTAPCPPTNKSDTILCHVCFLPLALLRAIGTLTPSLDHRFKSVRNSRVDSTVTSYSVTLQANLWFQDMI